MSVCPHVRDGLWSEWGHQMNRDAALEWSRHWRRTLGCSAPRWFQELVGDYIWDTRWVRHD